MPEDNGILHELRGTLGKMELALGSINQAILWIDQAGKVEWCNSVFDRLVGLPHIKILGQPLETLLPLEEHGTLLSGRAHPAHLYFSEDKDHRGIYRLAGTSRYLELRAKCQTFEEDRLHAVLVISDVTEREELEQVRLSSLALAAAANAIVITNSDGRVNWVNQAFTKLTGYGSSEVVGKTLSILRSSNNSPEIYEQMWQTISAGRPWSGQIINKKKNGELYTERQTITPVSDHLGNISHYIAIKEDVTQSIETSLRLTKYNSLLQALFMAHQQYIDNEEPGRVFSGLLSELLDFTDSEYGFIGEIKHELDGTPYLKTMAITNIAWNQETQKFYEDNAPDGLEFKNLKTLFGAAILTGKSVIANDPDHDPRAGGRPSGHPPLDAFLGVPLTGSDGLVGLVGIANRPGGYDQQVVDSLGPLLATCSSMIEAIQSEQERLATAEKLKVSEKRLRAILDAAADGIIAINQDGIIQSVNRASEKIFGYRTKEMVGNDITMLMPPPHDALHAEYVRRYIETRKPRVIGIGREVEGRRKDGSIFPLELSVSEVQLQDGVVFTGVLRDITARKAAEEEIFKLSLVAQYTDNAVVITDVLGNIQWVNQAFERITEYTLEEVEGEKPGHILQGPETDPETVARMSEALEQGEGFDEEIINYAKSGRKYWLSLEARPIKDERGQIRNFIAVEDDITRRKEAEQALASAREREVEVGARIQKTLLMGRPPEDLETIEFAANTIASQKIDGDFYDFYTHGSEVCDLLIGDVMGKGIPAALLGAATKSLFPLAMNQLIEKDGGHSPCPREIVSFVHALVARELIGLDSFVTLVYGRFNLNEMRLYFVDCGHTRTIHYSTASKEISRLSGVSMPLGFSTKDDFPETTVPLSPGDLLIFYSDGVTDAVDPEGNMYGEEGLVECVQANTNLSPQALIQTIQDQVLAYSGGDEIVDDLTLVVAKVGWPSGEKPAVSHAQDFPARVDELVNIRAFISRVLAEAEPDLQSEWLHLLMLAADEASTNVIKHAYQGKTGESLTLQISGFSDRWEIRILHHGMPFRRPAPLLVPPTGGQEGGYGLYLIDQTVDCHRYLSDEQGRLYTLIIKRKWE